MNARSISCVHTSSSVSVWTFDASKKNQVNNFEILQHGTPKQ